MRLKSFIFLTIFCFATISLIGQLEQNLLENNTDRAQFLMHIDTINKYLYRDAKLVDELIKKCELIKQSSNELTNDDLFKYVIQKIYYEQNNTDFLACYQLIKENEHLLADEAILEKNKNDFIYIRAFTYMTLGDSESAQESYYEILEKGRIQKDSLLILQSLYSLGQLYSDKNDYPSAIKIFLDLVELRKVYKIRPSTYSLIDYELSETYLDSGQLDKAEKVIISGLQFLEKQKIERLKPDFLLLQGQIALDQQKKSKAARIYQKIELLIHDNNDQFTLQNSQVFHAKLLSQQEKYTEALRIYGTLLSKVDTTDLNFVQDLYENAQTTVFKMGNINKAYQYLLKKQEIVKKIKEKEKQQKTAYLKVKFESDQKEKENQQLAIEILQGQNQSKYLYFIATFFFMGLLILFWAFYQKKKFNQILQTEVKNRTQELEQSNKELEKFAYMASHDLKQPLSTIINFSNLLNRAVTNSQNQENKIHLKYILDSSKRMMNLIESVLDYFNIDKQKQELEMIDLNELVGEMEIKIATYLTERNALIKIMNPLPCIKGNKNQMLVVFKNFIENGIKYNTSEKPSLLISPQQETDCIKIYFQDNGIGIEAKYHDKLFQMFNRLQNHQDYEGAGLGLSISKKIVNNMGGNIGIMQNIDSGSLFYFTIPTSLVAAYTLQR